MALALYILSVFLLVWQCRIHGMSMLGCVFAGAVMIVDFILFLRRRSKNTEEKPDSK